MTFSSLGQTDILSNSEFVGEFFDWVDEVVDEDKILYPERYQIQEKADVTTTPNDEKNSVGNSN